MMTRRLTWFLLAIVLLSPLAYVAVRVLGGLALAYVRGNWRPQ